MYKSLYIKHKILRLQKSGYRKTVTVVVWALIFLTKLRFPPGVSIAIVLKDRYKNKHSCIRCKLDNIF